MEAASVLTSKTRLPLSAKNKAVAAESPLPRRAQFLELKNAEPIMQSEEHLVLETPRAALVAGELGLTGSPAEVVDDQVISFAFSFQGVPLAAPGLAGSPVAIGVARTVSRVRRGRQRHRLPVTVLAKDALETTRTLTLTDVGTLKVGDTIVVRADNTADFRADHRMDAATSKLADLWPSDTFRGLLYPRTITAIEGKTITIVVGRWFAGSTP